MITPAYAPTATERVLPRLALDFTTGVLDPRVTITRALNTATSVNSSGVIVGVNSNLPRFDYDPSTLAAKGLLIEETRSNIALQSGSVNTSPWSFSGTVGGTTDAPDGTSSGRLLSTTGTPALSQTITVTTVAHTISIFVKAATASTNVVLRFAQASGGSACSVRLNAVTGVVTNSSTEPFTSVGVQNYGNGWYRVWGVGTATTTDGRFQVFPNAGVGGFTSGASGDAYFWGAQLEAGAFATSYIPTTTTSLTRNFDYVTMTGTNFSDWFNASEGSIYSEFVPFEVVGDVIWSFGAQYANSICGQVANNQQFFVVNGNVVQAGLDGGSCTANAVNKFLAAYKADSFALALGGAAPVTDTSGTLPTVSKLVLGSLDTVPTSVANCYFRKFNYWPQRVINAEVQAFSK